MLTALGYRATTQTSPIEALELFKSDPGRFDLVITDMTMPQMTGDLLAIEMKKIRPDIPVILCTGYSKRISDEIARAIGIGAFLMKPVVKLKMARTVRKVLDEAKARLKNNHPIQTGIGLAEKLQIHNLSISGDTSFIFNIGESRCMCDRSGSIASQKAVSA